MQYYLLLLLADGLLALNFAVTKVYQRQAGAALAAGLRFNLLLGLFTAAAFWTGCGFRVEASPYSVVMAAAAAALCVGYTLVGFQILRRDSVALYTVFLMCGGMTVPYLFGALFLGEAVSWRGILGLLLILISVWITHGGGKCADRRQLWLCGLVFLLNGFVSVVSKVHQVHPGGVSAVSFLVLNSCFKAVFSAVALLGLRLRRPSAGVSVAPVPLTLSVVGWIALSALLGGGSYLCQLVAAAALPATVVYPIVTGGSILLTVAAGWIFFRERVSGKMWIGIGLCVVGTGLFL